MAIKGRDRMNIIRLLIVGALFVLSGCSAINSKFSCNETASDSCMSIEQVDRLTSFADDYNRHPHTSKFGSKSAVSQNKTTQSSESLVWVAPWKDGQGYAHQEQVIRGSKDYA